MEIPLFETINEDDLNHENVNIYNLPLFKNESFTSEYLNCEYENNLVHHYLNNEFSLIESISNPSTSFISEMNIIIKKYIKMNNKDKWGFKCLFCLACPSTIQTIKEHYKISCKKYAEIEKRMLGKFNRNLFIFMVCFINLLVGLSKYDVCEIVKICSNLFGRMFNKFRLETNIFNGFFICNDNEEFIGEELYKFSKRRFIKKDVILDKLI